MRPRGMPGGEAHMVRPSRSRRIRDPGGIRPIPPERRDHVSSVPQAIKMPLRILRCNDDPEVGMVSVMHSRRCAPHATSGPLGQTHHQATAQNVTPFYEPSLRGAIWTTGLWFFKDRSAAVGQARA
jgi:hypothetical protein